MRECTNVLKKEEKPLNASSILYKLWFAAGKETFSENKITYICDFSRSGLNTRLYTLVSKPCSETTNIGYFILWELSLAAHANSEFILRKIWGRLQTVVTLRGVGILICHYNNSLCVNPTGFYSPNILYLLSSFSNPPTDFSSCQQAELLKINKAYLWPRSKVWIRACISEYSNRSD